MARRNDNSTDYSRWSNKKLLADIEHYVKFENASFAFPDALLHTTGCHEPREDSKGVHPDVFIKERTRIYFQSWVLPLIEELKDRLLD